MSHYIDMLITLSAYTAPHYTTSPTYLYQTPSSVRKRTCGYTKEEQTKRDDKPLMVVTWVNE